MPIIYLSNNFSKLQKHQNPMTLVNSSRSLSISLLSLTTKSRNTKVCVSKGLLLKTITRVKSKKSIRKKLVRLLRFNPSPDRRFSPSRNLRENSVPAGFRNSVNTAAGKPNTKKDILRSGSKPLNLSFNNFLDERYEFSSSNHLSRFINLNFRKKPANPSRYNNIYPAINLNSNALQTFKPSLSKELNFNTDVAP